MKELEDRYCECMHELSGILTATAATLREAGKLAQFIYGGGETMEVAEARRFRKFAEAFEDEGRVAFRQARQRQKEN